MSENFWKCDIKLKIMKEKLRKGDQKSRRILEREGKHQVVSSKN